MIYSECGMAVGVRLAGPSIPEAADLLGCFQPRFIKRKEDIQ